MGRLLLLAFALVVVTGCAGPLWFGQGRVSGLVAAWPARPNGGDIAPAPNRTVEFRPIDGGTTRTTVSASDGHFSIDLSPGSYEVHLVGSSAKGLLYGRRPETYGQWPRISVKAGGQIALDMIFDSGIL